MFWLAFWAWLSPLKTRPPKKTAELDRGVVTGTATTGTMEEAAGEATMDGAAGEIAALSVFVVIPDLLRKT